MTIFERCQGKRVDVDYETVYYFVIEYINDTQLRWHALPKSAEGAPDHEEDPYSSFSYFWDERNSLFPILPG